MLERVQRTSARLEKRLAELRTLPSVGDVRQRGLMAGVELVLDRETRQPFDAADRVGHLVCMAARKYGVILRPLGDVIVLMPPLSIGVEEIDLLADVLARCIVEVTGD